MAWFAQLSVFWEQMPGLVLGPNSETTIKGTFISGPVGPAAPASSGTYGAAGEAVTFTFEPAALFVRDVKVKSSPPAGLNYRPDL